MFTIYPKRILHHLHPPPIFQSICFYIYDIRYFYLPLLVSHVPSHPPIIPRNIFTLLKNHAPPKQVLHASVVVGGILKSLMPFQDTTQKSYALLLGASTGILLEMCFEEWYHHNSQTHVVSKWRRFTKLVIQM